MSNRDVRRAAACLVMVMGFVAASSAWAGRTNRPTLEGVVNINTASAEELQLLPGIGPAKAQRVMQYRAGRAFRTIEELARVKGIGPKTVRKLRPHLTVRGATTARAGAPTSAATSTPTSTSPSTSPSTPPSTPTSTLPSR